MIVSESKCFLFPLIKAYLSSLFAYEYMKDDLVIFFAKSERIFIESNFFHFVFFKSINESIIYLNFLLFSEYLDERNDLSFFNSKYVSIKKLFFAAPFPENEIEASKSFVLTLNHMLSPGSTNIV